MDRVDCEATGEPEVMKIVRLLGVLLCFATQKNVVVFLGCLVPCVDESTAGALLGRIIHGLFCSLRER